jgi:hypothetical protein
MPAPGNSATPALASPLALLLSAAAQSVSTLLTVTDLADKRVLVFIVAYNAEKTIASVLSRIPEVLRTPNVEVLIIDDFSKDENFPRGSQAR